jgi:hypothetical protein
MGLAGSIAYCASHNGYLVSSGDRVMELSKNAAYEYKIGVRPVFSFSDARKVVAHKVTALRVAYF